MLSIEMYKGIQERDEVIKELLEACEEVVKYQKGFGPSKTFGEVVIIVQQAIARANSASGEKKG